MAKPELRKETLRNLTTPENVRLADLNHSSVLQTMLQGYHPDEVLALAYVNELRAAGVPISTRYRG